jgi:hypothetical protein
LQIDGLIQPLVVRGSDVDHFSGPLSFPEEDELDGFSDWAGVMVKSVGLTCRAWIHASNSKQAAGDATTLFFLFGFNESDVA